MPRTVGRQSYRSTVPSSSPEEYWRRSLYFPFLDHLIEEIQSRLLSPELEKYYSVQYLLPHNVSHLSNDQKVKEIYTAYSADLPSKDHFTQEIDRWRMKWPTQSNEPESSSSTTNVWGAFVSKSFKTRHFIYSGYLLNNHLNNLLNNWLFAYNRFKIQTSGCLLNNGFYVICACAYENFQSFTLLCLRTPTLNLLLNCKLLYNQL